MILFREKILRQVAQFSVSHFKHLLLGTLILAALSGFLVSRLEFQSDVVNLLPAKAPATGAFVQFLKEFGSGDTLLIILERKSGGEVESFGPLAKILAERLMATGEFSEIHGWADQSAATEIGEAFIAKALLYLTEEDLRQMESRLTDEAIEKRVLDLKAKLHSPIGSWTSQWAVRDPLDLWSIFKKYIPAGGRFESGRVLLSEDRKMMLLLAKPKGRPSDVRYDEILLEKIRSAERAAKEAFRRGKNIDPGVDIQDLVIGLAGGHISALEDSRMIKKELLMNFTVSLVGVLTLFVLAFRSLISLLYALFPLMASPLLTLGLFFPFLGRLSESTGAFSAIILGLSIDFIILLYSRYLEERNAGQSLQESLDRSFGQTGPGVFTGGVTTTAAYYALLASDFRGVQELGFLTGTGILISLLCAFFLFPALVAWRERKKGKSQTFPAISSFRLERVSLWALKKPLLVVLLCTAITLGGLGWVSKVKLNNDPRKLRPADHPSLVLEEKVRAKMGEGQETIILMAESRTAEEALEVQGKVKEVFDGALALGLPLVRYDNLGVFIPPPSRQERNLQWIQARERESFNPLRLERKFKEVLQREGLRVEPFEAGLKILRTMLANRETITWEGFQKSPLKELGEKFLKKEGALFLSASYLQVKPDFLSDPQAANFLQELKRSGPNVRVTGSRLVQRELETLMVREAWKVLLIALAGVLALIYLDFRCWRLTLLSLLPVILASLWTLGLMGILGMDLNFMNLVVFTMVLGIGVDYGVHILHRMTERGATQLEAGLAQVGKGVVLAALTTVVGFGSLALSGYPGLRSMGAVALMGVGFSALIAMTLLPVVLQMFLPKRRSS